MKSTETQATAVYNVNEIFYSLQGEGFHTGTPAVFIRLAGCNLRCPFCDTPHTAFTPMDTDRIIELIVPYAAATVVLTGGEPTLHNLGPLVEALHGDRRRVHIETNGTRPVHPDIDWVTCSPKTLSSGPEAALHPSMASRADELKIVFQDTRGIEELARRFDTKNLFLQPCSCSNTAAVVEYIKAHPHWRLSLQTHKLIDIR